MTDAPADARNAEQIAFWNGLGGERWTKAQESADRVLAPVSAALLARAAAQSGERVMDIGCGCGDTSIALAESVGPTGHVLGLDVSETMLARARQRAPRGASVRLVLADATVHPFKPASYDLLVSRFGVMFFADPAASFANMRMGLRTGGHVAFACWREPKQNPWAMTPLQAVYKHVPRMPSPGPDDPGLFSFAQDTRVRRILSDAGFASTSMEKCDISFDIAQGNGLDAAVETALTLGPSMRAMKDATPEVKVACKTSIREALAPHVSGQSVPLGAGIWIVTAQNP